MFLQNVLLFVPTPECMLNPAQSHDASASVSADTSFPYSLPYLYLNINLYPKKLKIYPTVIYYIGIKERGRKGLKMQRSVIVFQGCIVMLKMVQEQSKVKTCTFCCHCNILQGSKWTSANGGIDLAILQIKKKGRVTDYNFVWLNCSNKLKI